MLRRGRGSSTAVDKLVDEWCTTVGALGTGMAILGTTDGPSKFTGNWLREALARPLLDRVELALSPSTEDHLEGTSERRIAQETW